MPSENGELRKRFWSKVDVQDDPDACWPWIPKTKGTYFRPGGRGTQAIAAHRIAYLLEVGTLPKGIHLQLTCGNSRCCNPKHIRGPVGTPPDRGGRTRIPMGERTRIPMGERTKIRAEHESGVTIKELHQKYKIQVAALLSILYEKSDL